MVLLTGLLSRVLCALGLSALTIDVVAERVAKVNTSHPKAVPLQVAVCSALHRPTGVVKDIEISQYVQLPYQQ